MDSYSPGNVLLFLCYYYRLEVALTISHVVLNSSDKHTELLGIFLRGLKQNDLIFLTIMTIIITNNAG